MQETNSPPEDAVPSICCSIPQALPDSQTLADHQRTLSYLGFLLVSPICLHAKNQLGAP